MDVIKMMSTQKESIKNYYSHLQYYGKNGDGRRIVGFLSAKGIDVLDAETGQSIRDLLPTTPFIEKDGRSINFETGFIDGLLESSFSDNEIADFIVRYVNLNLDALLDVRFPNAHPKVWFFLMGHVLTKTNDLESSKMAEILKCIHHAIFNMNIDDKQTLLSMLEMALKPVLQKRLFYKMSIDKLISEVRHKYEYGQAPVIVYFMVRAMRKWVDPEVFSRMLKDLHLCDAQNGSTMLFRYGFRRAICQIWPDLRYIRSQDIKGQPSMSTKNNVYIRIIEVDGNYALVEASCKTRYLLEKKFLPKKDRDIVIISTIKELPIQCDISSVLADQFI